LVKAYASNIIKNVNSSISTPKKGTQNQKTKEKVWTMKQKIVKAQTPHEYLTPERCYIAENHSDPAVSIARATVKPGVTTKAHHLIKGVQEIYIITSGSGKVIIGDLEPAEVGVGDVVVIPPLTSQKVTNTGKTDLVFYCVCTPRFTEDCYVDEKSDVH
jgi:mannose-6-phosphate isomerase-like protein (cupin superfamily)